MADRLRQELGVFSAMMLGLGSIVGTGVFVSIAIAANVTGPAVVLAIAIAAFVATCNGLSSAQLAACHPVSGGTYEYGYRFLTPWLGFTAGWMFMCAKSASAATAALGFGGYLLPMLGVDVGWSVTAAVAAAVALTVLVLSGLRRSNWMNIAIVSATLGALAAFVVSGIPSAIRNGSANMTPFFLGESSTDVTANLLEASAMMFVAYTGYGRIATMGEEAREPKRTIPRAIILTLVVTMILYIAVGIILAASVDRDLYTTGSAMKLPLEVAAKQFGVPGIAYIVAIGAITAMLGVLLNLILGLSRVLLAMGRRRDVPGIFGKLNDAGTTPVAATIAVCVIIAGLAMIGDVGTTWRFSAFTVLIYYSLTNLAALRLPPEARLFPRAFAWMGLAGCFFLAWWVDWRIWSVGVGLIVLGLAWHFIAVKLRGGATPSDD